MQYLGKLVFKFFENALFLLLVCAFLTSCNTTGCTENRSSLPQAGFYDYTTLQAISIDSITIGGVDAPRDSLLIDCATASSVYLPFRQTASEASFFLAYKQKALDYPELVDTLRFTYDPIQYFASEECGAMLRYRIRSVNHTSHLIDSVAVIPSDSIITNADIENLKLFFRTSTSAE